MQIPLPGIPFGPNRVLGGMLFRIRRYRFREIAMKRLILAVTFSIGFSHAVLAQGKPVPEIPFESVPHFLKMPPNLYLGEAAGVAVNSKGHVFVFSRGNTTGPAYGAGAAQLLEFGPDGAYLREIGQNLYA